MIDRQQRARIETASGTVRAPTDGSASAQRSLVYYNIFTYRLVMQVLYRGTYRTRFRRIINVMGRDVRSVCDLCFGDTYIAQWCRTHGVQWTGVEINHYFCERARRQGFTVREGDLFAIDLPHVDVVVMAAALYHFHNDLSALFDRVFSRSPRFIISEPVRNVSRGRLGAWAKYVANPGTGDATFRYDEDSLRAALQAQQARTGCQFRVVSTHRDMLIEVRR